MPPSKNYKDQPLWKEFFCGTTAAMIAGIVTHPIDLIKVRMQLRGQASDILLEGGKVPRGPRENPVLTIIRKEGPFAIYRGLTATLMRQCTYIGTKFGVYNTLKVLVSNPDGSLSFPGKCVCALGAGGVGAVVGNPADMCMVRMQADGRLPKHQRRGYRNVFDAMRRIVMEEGALTLWRGCAPTVQRGMIITAAQLAIYDDAKQKILSFGYEDGFPVHFTASMCSAFAASVASNPIDVGKTRLQTMRKGPDGNYPYKNLTDCLMRTIKNEGVFGLYKGFGPTFARQVPLNLTIFVALEQLRKLVY